MFQTRSIDGMTRPSTRCQRLGRSTKEFSDEGRSMETRDCSRVRAVIRTQKADILSAPRGQLFEVRTDLFGISRIRCAASMAVIAGQLTNGGPSKIAPNNVCTEREFTCMTTSIFHNFLTK